MISLEHYWFPDAFDIYVKTIALLIKQFWNNLHSQCT